MPLSINDLSRPVNGNTVRPFHNKKKPCLLHSTQGFFAGPEKCCPVRPDGL
jgi:hypothetical protein